MSVSRVAELRSDATTRLQQAAWALIVFFGAVVFYGNLRFGKDVLAIGLEDDFFYYAQAARNLVLHGVSSFDGIHLTNGYHPLWMVILTGITKLFGVSGFFHPGSVIPFAVALETVQFTLVLAISWLTLRIARYFCGMMTSLCLQLLLASWAIVLVRTGMEVGLALAVSLAMFWFRLRPEFRWSGKSCFLYGTLASVMVLSRLDSVLLVVLLFALDVVMNSGDGRARWRSGLSFAVGIWPVAAYWWINERVFHVLMPVSGTAKQLRGHHTPSVAALRSFGGYVLSRNSPLLGPVVVLTLLAAALLIVRMKRRIQPKDGVFAAVLIFPFLHLLTIVSLSDWPLWQWYLYPWLLSGTFAAIVILGGRERRASAQLMRNARLGFTVCGGYFAAYVLAVAALSNPHNNLPYLVGLEIRDFARGHGGIYAMGDRSGAVGFLSDRPVVQLEGLMMDRQYLENIRSRRDLVEVLHRYGVHYYISTRAVLGKDGCWTVKEPWQAGDDSPRMSGRLCQQPVAVFQHGAFVNDVFDLQQNDLTASR